MSALPANKKAFLVLQFSPTSFFIHDRRFLVTLLIYLLCNQFSLLYGHEGKTSTQQERENALITTYKTLPVVVPTKHGTVEVEVHFPPSKLRTAARVVEIALKDFIRIVNYFKSVPQTPVHITFDRKAKTANGAATVFPQNLIILHDYPPVGGEHLNGSIDWLRSLVLHEFIHILHLDMTDGILEILRHIFGSTAKLGGVVPRWFVEGLATWGESHFTDQGRLKVKDIDNQLLQGFFNYTGCDRIDCLDDPGHYPFRGYPYWVGSRFLAFVEQKKPGALACIVQDNSSNLPFFLNWPFKNCTGFKAQDLFQKFRMQFADKLPSRPKLPPADLKLKPANGWRVNWQKGAGITAGKLVFIEANNREIDERIVTVKLDGGKRSSHQLKERIDGIQFDPYLNNQMYVTTYLGLSGESKRFHFIYDLRKKIPVKVLDPKAQYYFKGKGKQVASVNYLDGVWKYNQHELEHFYLTNPFMANWDGKRELAYVTLNQQAKAGRVYALKLFDPESKLTGILKSSKASLKLLGQCGGELLVQQNGQLLGLGTGSWRKYELSMGQFSQFILSSENLIVERVTKESRDFFVYRSCQKFLANFSSTPIERQGQAENLVKITPDKTLKNFVAKSYPKFKHYLPHHWIATYGNSGGLDAISLSTTMQDPNGNNAIGVEALYYTSLGKLGSDLAAVLDFDDFTYQLNYFKNFQQSDGLGTLDRAEGVTNSIYNESLNNAFDGLHSRQIFVHKEKKNDFVSNRKFIRYGLNNSFTKLGNKASQAFGHLSASGQVYYQDTRRHRPFWGMNLSLRNGWRLNYSNRIYLKSSYGRLFKRRLASGSLFGGGSLSGAASHGFYGFDYGQLYGNFIVTGGAEYELDALNLYKGWGFVPIYFKELKVLGGTNYAYAENTLIESELFQRQHHVSVYLGAGMGLNVAYLLPLRIDLVLAKVITTPAEEIRPLILLKSSL